MKGKKMTEAQKRMLDMKQKMEIDRTINTLNTKSTDLQAKIDELVIKAKDAQKKGSKSALQIAKTGLANAISTKNHIDEMICQLDIVCSMKDIATITNDFLGTVDNLCDSINQYSKELDFKNVNKQLSVSMENSERTISELDKMMNSLLESSSVQNYKMSGEVSNEIDNLLVDEPSETESNKQTELDDEISKRLADLKI